MKHLFTALYFSAVFLLVAEAVIAGETQLCSGMKAQEPVVMTDECKMRCEKVFLLPMPAKRRRVFFHRGARSGAVKKAGLFRLPQRRDII